MSMQDKDLDALFSGKLKHLEVEPSAKVWKGITLELDGVKHRSKLMPVIRIAASVILVMSVGIFFLMKGEKPQVSIANNIHQRPKSIKELKDETSDKTISEAIHPKPITQQLKIANAIQKQSIQRFNKPTPKIQTTNKAEQPQTKPEIIVGNQPELAAANIEHPVVPDVQLVAHHDVYANDKFITANTEVPGLPMVKLKEKKRGIRTIGDLINVVVAKVDKRDDKIIEFSNTDDGSIVSGINLGLIRIKKD